MIDFNKKPTGVVIAVRRGVIQEAIKATLADIPWLKIAAFATEGSLVVPAIQAQNPRLLMLDSDLAEGDISVLISQIKNAQPNIRCLVLTQTTRQQTQALTGGADAVFPRSGSVDALSQALKDLCFVRRATT